MRNDPGEHTLSGAFLRLYVISKNKEPSPVPKRPSKRRVYQKNDQRNQKTKISRILDTNRNNHHGQSSNKKFWFYHNQ